MAVVSGAGNIRRRRDNQDSGMRRHVSDTLGMVGTLINATVLHEKVFQHGGTSVVYSAPVAQVPTVAQPYDIGQAQQDLTDGKIVFCAGGTTNPYFTTDSAAVLRALELECDLLVKATKVDGVYDKDPMKHDDAIRYDKLSLQEAYKQELNIMDHSALALAMDNDLSMLVCKVDDMSHVGTDKIQGTYVTGE